MNNEPSSPDSPQSPAPKKILVAEDNPVNQRLATLLLRGWGHEVTVAEDGAKTVAEWESGAYDLILMDIQMPEMDGLMATAAIRSREKSKGTRIPILAMTAHVMQQDRNKCLAAGMDEYLTKPIRRDILREMIERFTNV